MSDYFDSILSDFGVEASDETHVYQLTKAELVGIVRGTKSDKNWKPSLVLTGKLNENINNQ